MAPVDVRRTVPTPLGAVWDTLTDFGAYGDWIPLTSMRTDPPPVRLGWGFGGFTGFGPVGFLDSMLVVKWEPPADGAARFAVRKTGRVLAGWADVRLTATDAGGTEVLWREEIVPRPEPLGRLAAPATDRVTTRLFAAALDRMLEAAATRTTTT
ncbi:MAG TPA: SRPBCC family protein [Lapillicoccus sp.]|nr:SRPBCC family protein [Lapillicoccus sp.]